MKKIFALGLGTLFGFLLSRSGATTYDFHAEMFLLENFQLVYVIGAAVVTASIGIWILKQFQVNSVADCAPIDFAKKPDKPGLLFGAVLFGIGWAMTASCPGSVPAMLGEGKISAIFVIVGILIGTFVYGRAQDMAIPAKTDNPTQ